MLKREGGGEFKGEGKGVAGGGEGGGEEDGTMSVEVCEVKPMLLFLGCLTSQQHAVCI